MLESIGACFVSAGNSALLVRLLLIVLWEKSVGIFEYHAPKSYGSEKAECRDSVSKLGVLEIFTVCRCPEKSQPRGSSTGGIFGDTERSRLSMPCSSVGPNYRPVFSPRDCDFLGSRPASVIWDSDFPGLLISTITSRVYVCRRVLRPLEEPLAVH